MIKRPSSARRSKPRRGSRSAIAEQVFESAKRGQRCRDYVSRNRAQVVAVTALCFEARAELGLGERVEQARNDSARDVYAAQRARREREVRGHGAEHREKHLQRLTRERLALAREARNVLGRDGRLAAARELRERNVQIHESLPRQRTLGGAVAETLAQQRDHVL